MPSKIFGPTDSVADTLTQVGSTYQMPPGSVWNIYKLRVGFGNVVNAKECAGFIHVETADRMYDFAFGNGVGGATNSSNGPADIIECSINVAGNSSVKIHVLQAEVSKDVTVSAQFKSGAGPVMRTMAAGGAGQDTTADTALSLTSNAKLSGASLQPAINGAIKQIRFAGSGVVDAKAGSGKLIVTVPGEAGPYEYTVGMGPGGATLGAGALADVIDIPEGIPVKAQGNIIVTLTSAEIVLSATVSFSYW